MLWKSKYRHLDTNFALSVLLSNNNIFYPWQLCIPHSLYQFLSINANSKAISQSPTSKLEFSSILTDRYEYNNLSRYQIVQFIQYRTSLLVQAEVIRVRRELKSSACSWFPWVLFLPYFSDHYCPIEKKCDIGSAKCYIFN